MKILEAIYRRKSVRDFADSAIEKDILDRIRLRASQIDLLYKKSNIKCLISEYCRKSYYAPYYIGIYTDNTKEGVMNAGFVLQQLVVYLSAIGIASCYQAKPAIFKPVNSEGMKLTISLAFGYPGSKMYREKNEVSRLAVDKICVIKEQPNEEVERLIELARISPSSYNTQPWRFVVYNNRIHVFAKKKMLNRLSRLKFVNMGVMLGNVCLGAEELWIDIELREVKDIKSKEFRDNEYVITLFNRNTEGRRI